MKTKFYIDFLKRRRLVKTKKKKCMIPEIMIMKITNNMKKKALDIYYMTKMKQGNQQKMKMMMMMIISMSIYEIVDLTHIVGTNITYNT